MPHKFFRTKGENMPVCYIEGKVFRPPNFQKFCPLETERLLHIQNFSRHLTTGEKLSLGRRQQNRPYAKSDQLPFVLFVGTKKLVKHREFEPYIRRTMAI